MNLKPLSADLLNLTIVVDKSVFQGDPYHEYGVVNEYAGMLEFVDNYGNVRITRANETVRKYLQECGYRIKKGGSVHQVNSEFVSKMLWSKLENLYGKGYTYEQVENIIKNDHDLQLALSFSSDLVYRDEEFNNDNARMSMRNYSGMLVRKSDYLNSSTYKEKIFEDMIKPEIYFWGERRDNEYAQDSGGRGVR